MFIFICTVSDVYCKYNTLYTIIYYNTRGIYCIRYNIYSNFTMSNVHIIYSFIVSF